MSQRSGPWFGDSDKHVEIMMKIWFPFGISGVNDMYVLCIQMREQSHQLCRTCLAGPVNVLQTFLVETRWIGTWINYEQLIVGRLTAKVSLA